MKVFKCNYIYNKNETKKVFDLLKMESGSFAPMQSNSEESYLKKNGMQLFRIY